MAISGTDWLEVPTIYKAYVRAMYGNISTKYGLIWYSTSILGSWNSHWMMMMMMMMMMMLFIYYDPQSWLANGMVYD